MVEEFAWGFANLRVHGAKKVKSRLGNYGEDDAPVLLVAVLANEPKGFQAAEQASDIGLGRDHAGADGRAGQRVRMSTPEDAQDVVLRGSKAPGPRRLLHRSL